MTKLLLLNKEQAEKLNWISANDKHLIEKIVGIQGVDEKTQLALRGYLVQLWREMIPDDKFREEVDGMAAAWSDGYTAGRSGMIAWVRKQELNTMMDDPVNFDYYVVRRTDLDKL